MRLQNTDFSVPLFRIAVSLQDLNLHTLSLKNHSVSGTGNYGPNSAHVEVSLA